MQDYQRQFIELALAHGALKFGEFTLKSGRVSPYFFNMGAIYSGKALAQLGQCYAAALQTHLQTQHLSVDVIFGPAYKGIPLACSISIAFAEHHGRDVAYSFNRKEAKDHGEGGTLVGAPLQGNVVIVDDVITAGTAIRESMHIMQHYGANLIGILIALDRQERGQSAKSALQEISDTYQVPVNSIVTLTDILRFLNNNAQYAQYVSAIENYLAEYGVEK
ncbi:MAG: orotate phosphoribosyltransferase [Gammaproteobacteria bacterium]